MDVARRLKFGLAALVALVVSALSAAPAMASTQADPTESNIPYLAWRGEQIRLVKCHPVISPTGAGQRADLILVDWSGEEHALAIPHLETSTAGFLAGTGIDHLGQGCVAGSFVSQKAGLAQIKLVVSVGGSGSVGTSVTGTAGTPILKHDYLVGWMNLNTPTISATNGTMVAGSCTFGTVPAFTCQIPTGGGVGATAPATDPAALIDNAGGAPNNFRVDVTGNIPLRANFRELGLGDSLTMPNDWARLANVMASFFHPNHPNPAANWDIHDDRTLAEAHGDQSVCPTIATGTAGAAERAARFDAVDNCPQFLGTPLTYPTDPLAPIFGQPEYGAFSRIWNSPTNPTVGPFDPLVPRQTLLTDGNLNSEDAPMPAARVDFEVVPNAGGTDIGGVGFFGCVGDDPVPGEPGCSVLGSQSPALVPNQFAKDKHWLYSRNSLGTQSAGAPFQHNLYAPFYGRFIPATARAAARPVGLGIAEASGEDGPAGGVLTNPGGIGTNNFEGWLVNGLYHYWDIARVLRSGTGAATTCLFRRTGDGTATDPLGTRVFRALPSGPQRVAIYTDEHGEGHVWWYPGTGFYFGNLGALAAANLNLGCDLQGINPIGRAQIRATARYPYEPVTDAPKVSNTLTKTVNSLFSKRVFCQPKGPNPNDQFAQICIIEARDITGSAAPFVGERVCIATNGELIQRFAGTVGAITIPLPGTPFAIPVDPTSLGKAGAAVLCSRLDAAGRAAVEVFGKGPSNVIVDFVDEGLIRVVTFNFPSGTGTTGTETGTPTGEVAVGTTAPTTQQINSVNNSTGTQVKDDGKTVTNQAGSKPEIAAPSAAAPQVLAKVSRADLVRPVVGTPYLLVRVDAKQPTVKIKIRMVGARTTVSTIERVIKTNRLVKVGGLKIAKTVKTLRVSIAS